MKTNSSTAVNDYIERRVFLMNILNHVSLIPWWWLRNTVEINTFAIVHLTIWIWICGRASPPVRWICMWVQIPLEAVTLYVDNTVLGFSHDNKNTDIAFYWQIILSIYIWVKLKCFGNENVITGFWDPRVRFLHAVWNCLIMLYISFSFSVWEQCSYTSALLNKYCEFSSGVAVYQFTN